MGLVERIDDIGKPAWIGLLVLSFFIFWPAALALLAFLIWSGRMGCWGHNGRFEEKMERMQAKMDRMRERAGRWGGWQPPSSGNRAFDEYRAETLRRLEEEQKEFREFLDRLRHARDKAEFDQFMAERRRPRDEGPTPSPA
ncbi:MAG TPA: DUF2852 domain-containing protein [Alphaproteobacteria bacterium]|nr:DUF2852 domain-containing protein [Alphaproteobacteria bacterium]